MAFRAAQGRHGLRIARVLRGLLPGGVGRVAGLDHRFQRFPLVLHVALGHLDQVGNQVVAAFELHVDLREGVLVAVPQGHQLVVHPDDNDRQDQEDREKHTQNDQSGPHRKVTSTVRRVQLRLSVSLSFYSRTCAERNHQRKRAGTIQSAPSCGEKKAARTGGGMG